MTFPARPSKADENREMTSVGTRFEALDAWRGLSAILVAMFHLEAYSHIYDSTLLRHSYLFVDFFFVLSGFVITSSYRTKLLKGFSFWHFMFLRLGRLYPLHIVILAAFIAIEVLRYRFNGFLGGDASAKFSGPHSIAAILTNVLLIQSLGIHKMLTWNLPSWSISVEFYTYAVFAIALLLLRSRIYIFVVFVILVTPLLLLKFVGQIDTDYELGFLRCLLGFFVGVACFDLYLLIGQNEPLRGRSVAIISLVEICSVALVVLFICLCGTGPLSLAAPLVFGVTVIIFSLEAGLVSKTLKLRLFVLLGTLSYSIYMVHALILVVMSYSYKLAERQLGVALLRKGYFGATLWQGDVSYGILICLVLAVSYLTYSFIEEPGRRQSRKISERFFVAPKSANLDLVRLTSKERMQLPDENNQHRNTAQEAASL